MAVDMWRTRGDGMTLREAVDRLFDQAVYSQGQDWPRGQNAPGRFPLNVYEDSEAYHVWALLPGVDPEKINITATGSAMAIEAESSASAPDGWRQVWGEWQPMRWRRELSLPAACDVGRAEVSYEHGMLKMRLPKPETIRPKTLKVNVKAR